MADSEQQSVPIRRISSGISGLDVILEGGFFRAGIYILTGAPGAGKTILANQISFNHVSGGGRVVYLTLLAETHARMLQHLRTLDFFDPKLISGKLHYISGYQELEDKGLGGLLKLLRDVVQSYGASVLVIDGLVTAEAVSDSEVAFKRFIHELQILMELHGCTTLLLSQPDSSNRVCPEHTMVDGLMTLYDRSVGVRAVRELEVQKHRGSAYLRGRHSFHITDAGITVYPRTETLLAHPTLPEPTNRRKAFDLPEFDQMLDGGLLEGSATLLLGAPGTGKTSFGLQFLAAGARQQERGLIFNFYETQAELVECARYLNVDLGKFIDEGVIGVEWQPPIENLLDLLAERLLNAVRQRKVKRLLIDDFQAFQEAAIYPKRLSRFFAALIGELRALGVTTLIPLETPYHNGRVTDGSRSEMAIFMQNIIHLRSLELRSRHYRLLSVLKMRRSAFDPTVRQFRFSDKGIEVAGTEDSAEMILAGQEHPDSMGSGAKSTTPRAEDHGQ